MERLDALVVVIDEREVVELLQHEVAGVIENARGLVATHGIEESLERHAIVQVFARMDLVAQRNAGFAEHIEHRAPAAREFLESHLHQSRRALRPRIHHGPQQCAGKRGVCLESQPRGWPVPRMPVARRPTRAMLQACRALQGLQTP